MTKTPLLCVALAVAVASCGTGPEGPQGLPGEPGVDSLGRLSCQSGEVAQWNGSAWVCGQLPQWDGITWVWPDPKADPIQDPCVSLNGQHYNVIYFGAKGDGTTDDSPAIQSALTCLLQRTLQSPVKVAVLYFPAGHYRFANRVTLEGLQDYQPSDSLGVVIRGEGQKTTVLKSYNSNGIFQLSFGTRRIALEVRDLGLVASQPDAGTALDVYIPPGGSRHHRNLTMRDVEIQNDESTVNYFKYGLKSEGLHRPLLENVFMTGPFGPNATENIYSTEICFWLKESYRPTVSHSRCWSAKTGVQIDSYEDPGTEDFIITYSNFVEVHYGVRISNVGREPGGTISFNHINAATRGVEAKNVKLIQIQNNLFYNANANADFYQDVFLGDSEKAFVRDNIFHFNGNQKRSMVRLADGSQDIFVSGNIFNGPGSAISTAADVTGATIFNNHYFMSASPGDGLLSQDIVDGSGTALVKKLCGVCE